MGLDSIWHWLILLVIVLALFGGKKLTNIGPDLGKAVREFKKAMHSGDEKDEVAKGEESLKADPPAAQAQAQAPAPADAAAPHQAQHESTGSK